MTDPKTLTDEQIDDIATRYGTMTQSGWLFRSEQTLRDFAGEIEASATREQTASTGEPVAWRVSTDGGWRYESRDPAEWLGTGHTRKVEPLYAAPVEQAGSPGETTSEFAERAKWFGTPQSTYTPVDAVEQAGSPPLVYPPSGKEKT